MDEQDRLRLEHDQGVELLRGLTEIRFKLLALVPTLAGAVVALVSRGSTGAELLAIGVLGLAATAGVLVYELRNTEIARHVGPRVSGIQTALFGAPLVPEPRVMTHGRAIALVYGAAGGGWCYLVAWGALRTAGASNAQSVGLVLGGIAGVALAVAVERLERRGPR